VILGNHLQNRMKKIYRSRENNVITGVIGGIGEYFNVDPVLLRLLWIFVTVFSAFVPGIAVYLAAVLVIPKRPMMHRVHEENNQEAHGSTF